MMTNRSSLVLGSLLGMVTQVVGERLLASVFTEHMVLQRDAALPVWGSAAPGETVEVRFAGQTKQAVAGQFSFLKT